MSENYDLISLRKPQSIAELDRDFINLEDIIGYDINKKGNVALIEDNVLIFTAGSSIVFLNLITKSREYLTGLDECGISSVEVHPSR